MTTQEKKRKFDYLKTGDKVTRLIGEEIHMPMVVAEVRDTTILCNGVMAPNVDASVLRGGWEFDIETGAEEDAVLGWGVKFGRTGSRLILDGEVK